MRIYVETAWVVDRNQNEHEAVWITLGTVEVVLRLTEAVLLAKKLTKALDS